MMKTNAILSFLVISAAVSAQDAPRSASSATHFLSAFEFGAGGRSADAKHVLDGSLGSGVTAQRASTSRHVLTGGFNAALDVPILGDPWISAVTPRFTAMRTGATLTIHGAELKKGTSVEIGGKAATILSSAPNKITVRVPNQAEPGFRPVKVKSSTGSTTLPQGLGVLPLIQEEPAAASGVPFSLAFRGTKGDTVMWAIGIQQSVPIKIHTFLHGLAINPLIVVPGFTIPSPDGVARLGFPAQTYPTGNILVQALFVSSNPGYAPGAFSNVLRL